MGLMRFGQDRWRPSRWTRVQLERSPWQRPWRHWRHWRPSRLAGSLALALLASACQSRPLSVTVPIASWPGYEYFYLAEQQGLDRRQGLQLTTSQFHDPQTIVHAYLRGEVAIAPLTTVEAIDICARMPRRCPVVVLVLDESRGGDQVAARLGIDSIAELRGRTVGVTFSSLGPYVLSRALERHGLSLEDVEVRNMSLAAMPAALASGRVDAVAFFPPYSEQAAREGRSRRLFDSGAIPGELFDVLVVAPDFYREHRPTLVRLLRSWQAAHALARAQPQQAQALMARREGISPAEFAQAERGLVYFSLRQQLAMLAPNGTLERNLRAVHRVQQQLHLIPASAGGTAVPLPRVSDAPLQEALQMASPQQASAQQVASQQADARR